MGDAERMQIVLNSTGNWIDAGIIIFGLAYLAFFLINFLYKRRMRLLAGSIVGLALSVLDMFLMYTLWFIPLSLKALILGFFGYSCWALFFKLEELDYNGRLFAIGISTMVVTYIENIVVGGLGTGVSTYPVWWWSYLTTLVYFGGMFILGIALYLFLYKKLTKDENIKLIIL